jgi:hypothetical protein
MRQAPKGPKSLENRRIQRFSILSALDDVLVLFKIVG